MRQVRRLTQHDEDVRRSLGLESAAPPARPPSRRNVGAVDADCAVAISSPVTSATASGTASRAREREATPLPMCTPFSSAARGAGRPPCRPASRDRAAVRANRIIPGPSPRTGEAIGPARTGVRRAWLRGLTVAIRVRRNWISRTVPSTARQKPTSSMHATLRPLAPGFLSVCAGRTMRQPSRRGGAAGAGGLDWQRPPPTSTGRPGSTSTSPSSSARWALARSSSSCSSRCRAAPTAWRTWSARRAPAWACC